MWFVFCCCYHLNFLPFYFRTTIKTSQIIWNNRYTDAVRGQSCFVSLDALDIKILEPTPFDARWFSHKFHGPGLKYEIGLNIRNGDIVWAFGGYPCGEFPDLCLAREAFVLALNDNERAMADKVYKDPSFITPNSSNSIQHNLIMSRHETVNKRLRQFNILKIEFRYVLQKLPMIFHVIAN